MQSVEQLKQKRIELVEGLKVLVGLFKDVEDSTLEQKLLFISPSIASLRMLDWILCDEDINMDDYFLKTNYDISKEIGFNVVTGQFY